ncbi:MAG TPA: MEDS domain-containing protein [Nocardioides sp.]|nr:MEDS domain-containing protein [Nocardioides sp.]
MGAELSVEPHAHAVSVYVHDQEVVDELARFIADGVLQEGRAVVVATPQHRTALVETLHAMGLDPDEPPVAGHLILLDAQQTLRSFTTPSGLDRDRFQARVGQVVIDAGADGAPVRVFGEMVGLLWEAGDVQGAIALEAMWNDLIPQVGFDLMCAYPAALIETSSLVEVRAVCDQHTSVRAPDQHHAALDSDHAESSRLFLPVSESVGASRNFVAAQLRRLEAEDLVHDATVIVSELATNAVRHARSPFRVSVSEVGGLVCISVKDVGEGRAALPTTAADDHAIDGRGMAIIDALAHRWGYSALDDGKVVWAQLAS